MADRKHFAAPAASSPAAAPLPAANPIVRKYSVRFAKVGRARFLSHHDLLRFWERAVRKAGLPVRYSEGFNPRPRLVFPHPLGLGIASRCEEVEIEFTAAVSAEEVRAKMATAVAPVLAISAVTVLPPRRQGRQAISALYAARGWRDPRRAAAAAEALWQAATAEMTREREGERQQIDLKSSLLEIRAEGETIYFRLRLGSKDAARPEEVVRWLGAAAGEEESAVEIERQELVLRYL
ncbi:MAG: TIGR03936 family radical SAM-associated protein [Planctomycetota bacterium]|nr:TIGR03936 family radical SAM-associated protein [Planctomycetota bacterium]